MRIRRNIFLALMFSLTLSSRLIGQGVLLPGYEESDQGLRNIGAELNLQKLSEKFARFPFEKWIKAAYYVAEVRGKEYAVIYLSDSIKNNGEVTHTGPEGPNRKWALTLFHQGGEVGTCNWEGDRVVGFFPVFDQKGHIKRWFCAVKPHDKDFFDTTKKVPYWADAVESP